MLITGTYRAHVGDLAFEKIEVICGRVGGSIGGPIWNGIGTIRGDVWHGSFVDVVGGAAGHHVATPNADGSMSVEAYFDGTPEPIALQWRPVT